MALAMLTMSSNLMGCMERHNVMAIAFFGGGLGFLYMIWLILSYVILTLTSTRSQSERKTNKQVCKLPASWSGKMPLHKYANHCIVLFLRQLGCHELGFSMCSDRFWEKNKLNRTFISGGCAIQVCY